MEYKVNYWTHMTRNKTGHIGKGSKPMSDVCPFPDGAIINDEQLMEIIQSQTVNVMIWHQEDGTFFCCIDDIKCRFQQR